MHRHLLIIIVGFCTAQCAVVDPYKGVTLYKLLINAEAYIKQMRTTADRIADHGYPVEHHYITTKDGYIIGAFRIPYSHKLQNKGQRRPIVLIQHGLMSSSDVWVASGPNDALPFLLVDAGYDVWLGNARGNVYSRNHTTLLKRQRSFWRFSWHEIGLFDMAAVIDYALSKGQSQKSLHYIGHSQGSTVFFALMSMRPDYNSKIKTAHMLGPVAFMKNLKSWLVRGYSPNLGDANSEHSRRFSSQEFLPYNDFLLELLYYNCQPTSFLRPFCESFNSFINSNRVNTTATMEIISTRPAGCSTDQILHYLQELQSGEFRQFDFGTEKNLKVYGEKEPPVYPVWYISSKVHLWYSDNDDLAAVEDVLRLAELLPHKVLHHMDDPLWTHSDFSLHWEVRKYINEPIIEIMEHYEKDSADRYLILGLIITILTTIFLVYR